MTFGLEFALAGALLAPAQPPQPNDATRRSAVTYGPQHPARQQALYEEIEVMRQLLARKLRPFATGTTTADLTVVPYMNRAVTAPLVQDFQNYNYMALQNLYPQTQQPGRYTTRPAQAAASVEGAYLDGHGVVFTVSLPGPAGDPRPSDKTPAPPTANEWDRIRQELRGEKQDATPATKPSTPTVGDVVLQTLAENGRHFEQLRPEDRVTVVVTFRGRRATAVSQVAQATVEGVTTAQQPVFLDPVGLPGQNVTPNTVKNLPRTTNDHELLGDLHLRQQQYVTAIEAYQKALQIGANSEVRDDPSAGSTPQKVAEQLQSLMAKLAQAQVGAGKLDEARTTLERAQKLLQEVATEQDRQAQKAAVAAGPSKLPPKMTISAPKGLLDMVGSGKMEFEAFRRQAVVEYLTFAADKEPDKKPRQ